MRKLDAILPVPYLLRVAVFDRLGSTFADFLRHRSAATVPGAVNVSLPTRIVSRPENPNVHLATIQASCS